MTTTVNDLDWTHRASQLAAHGVLTDPAWREAFEKVPRHVFVPGFWALDTHNAPTRLVDGAPIPPSAQNGSTTSTATDSSPPNGPSTTATG
ncbi:MAG: hypothetical protein JO100_04295 [Pseudonocardia sp.]|nr:hypothetical protein [Pseudonocardia sp.]